LTLFIPDAPVLTGLRFNCQAVAFDNNAPLGLVLSNGLGITFGF
jgi:hypothetical protein